MAGLLDFLGAGASSLNGLLGGVPGMAAQQANGLLGGIPGQLGGMGVHELQALGLLSGGQQQQPQMPPPQQDNSGSVLNYGSQTGGANPLQQYLQGISQPQTADPQPQGNDVAPVTVRGSRPIVPFTGPAESHGLSELASVLTHTLFTGADPLSTFHGIENANLQRRAALQQNQAINSWLQNQPPAVQAAFIMNPEAAIKNYQDQFAPQNLKMGETRTGMYGQPIATANVVGIDNGRGYSVNGSGQLSTGGQNTGPVVDAKTGVDTRGTQGQIPVTTVENVAPGASAVQVTPQIGQPLSPFGLPGINRFPSAGDINSKLPGATITSGLRSPAQNAAAGGVPNSYHMSGQAFDLVPPKGVSMADFSKQVSDAFPNQKVLNEGSHVHLQPVAPNTPSGARVLAQGKGYTGDINGVISGPDGKPMEGPGVSMAKGLRDSVLQHEDYKQYTAANTAFKAMVANIDKMNGPSAYSILDTMARTINPGAVARPTVIETIEKSLGLSAQVIGQLEKAGGMGNLPPAIRQQVIDSVGGFVKAHYGAAKALNDQNAQIAQRQGIDPLNATAPLEDVPGGVHLQLPPRNQLQVGDVYITAKGPGIWTGTGFKKYAQ